MEPQAAPAAAATPSPSVGEAPSTAASPTEPTSWGPQPAKVVGQAMDYSEPGMSDRPPAFSSKVLKQADGRYRAEVTNLPGVRPQFGRTSSEATQLLQREVALQWKLGPARPKPVLRHW